MYGFPPKGTPLENAQPKKPQPKQQEKSKGHRQPKRVQTFKRKQSKRHTEPKRAETSNKDTKQEPHKTKTS